MHAPFNAPIIMVSPESAQMGKYSANAYLATRITFINQIADLCEENGADVQEVIKVIGEDKRIGKHYWYPGLGYGGSCFPKDVRELAAYSRTIGHGNNLFNKIHELNADRIYEKLDEFESMVGGWDGRTVAVLGLSFKPNTDDLREAPSTKIVPHLLHKGAKVLAHDPMALGAARQVLDSPEGLAFLENLQDAVDQADVLLVVIEWPEYVAYPFDQVAGRGRLFVDARNQFDPEKLQRAGWRYVGLGRRMKA
jgi:UDPglucose 6-dehydrogenase